MTDDISRYFLAAFAFAFVVTWATLGALVAIVAAAVCLAVVLGPSARRPARGRRRPAPRRTTASELVPDEPSLIFTTSQ